MTEFNYAVSDVAASPGLTPSQTVGPFFHCALPYDAGPNIAGPSRSGAFRLAGQILDGADEPVPDALVEVWQADESGHLGGDTGFYDDPTSRHFRGFGRAHTDDEGRYVFRTVLPGAVPTADGAAQAPHIAMQVFARGMLRQVATRVYFPGNDAENTTDPLLSALSPDRAATMVATSEADGYRFDVHLQGDLETVFFDIFAR